MENASDCACVEQTQAERVCTWRMPDGEWPLRSVAWPTCLSACVFLLECDTHALIRSRQFGDNALQALDLAA